MIYVGRFGPRPLAAGGYAFRFYAPAAKTVALEIGGRRHETAREGDWFTAEDADARPGSRYAFVVDDHLRVPDPASRFQPEGVHGPSEIVGDFAWPQDGWRGIPWPEQVVYELHVGTFTHEGTYAGVVSRLDELVDLGVTTIELMPLAAFPGARNWGYDGVLPYAPFAGYGRPEDLKKLIVAAHAKGLAVMLDVVYNHFGPEGNYLHAYAPTFFTDRFHTPWGAAIDVTVPDVRAFFAENAGYWLGEYRFDGLRFDAVHAIVDPNHPAFMRQVRSTAINEVAPNRRIGLVVENDLNDVVLLDDGYDAQWNDDVHHCAHVIATGEREGYYRDYADDPVGLLGRALATGYAYQGEPSTHRDGKPRGASSVHLPLRAFVNFLQNHDQIGNRAFGERIGRLAPFAAVRALAALLLLAPSPPLLFMGEEWNASTPFLFFCDFGGDLAKAVTEGRRNEFASFPAFADPKVREEIPDPEAPETFAASQLRWEEREAPAHAEMLALYRTLLHARNRWVRPVVRTIRGTDATLERIGGTGLRLGWKLADGMLHADAQLGPDAAPGFAERLDGEALYSTHGEVYHDGMAPGWSVRWTRT